VNVNSRSKPNGKKKKRYPRNEALYNKIQENEFPIVFACLPGAILAVLDRTDLGTKRGRKPKNLYDILTCLFVKKYLGFSLRRSMGMLRVFNYAGIIDVEIPCFKTLNNYLLKKEIRPYLQKLMILTSDLFSSIERYMATDATGIATNCYSSWYSIRIKRESEKRDHLMVHISVGTKSNVVAAIDIRTHKGEDNVIFRSHVKQVGERFDIDEWSGDKMYLTRENCDAVVEIGATPWLKIKSNTISRAKGSTSWKKMVQCFNEEPEVANQKYHRRSNVESTNSSKKRKCGSSVSSRLPTAQINEELLSWVGYNFSLIPRAKYEFEIEPDFIAATNSAFQWNLFYT